jgi:hypothetical protein
MIALAKVMRDGNFQLLPILNIFVPQVGQTPWVAGLPFFIVMALASFISFLVRHLTQYACMVVLLEAYSQSGIADREPERQCQGGG